MASSRREFLYTAAGGISASWGGLLIFAGPGVSSPPSPRDEGALAAPSFVYGTAFYRPPNPPASMRRAMLKTLAQEYKFNTIRIFSSWVYHSREPERFNFEELEEVMGYCDELGLRVLNGVNTEYAPYWLEAAHPETRYVDCERPVRSIGRQQWQCQRRLAGALSRLGTGAPGRCKIHPGNGQNGGEASLDVRLRLLERTAHGAIRGGSSLYGYDGGAPVLLLPPNHRRISALARAPLRQPGPAQ